MDNLLFQLCGLAPLPPLAGLNWDVLFTLMAYDQAACICHPLQNSSLVGGLWAELLLPSLAQAVLTPFVCHALALHNRSSFWDSLSVMQLPSAESFWTAVLLEYISTTRERTAGSWNQLTGIKT